MYNAFLGSYGVYQLLLFPVILLFLYYKISDKVHTPIKNYVKIYIVMILQWALLSIIIGRPVFQDSKVFLLALLILLHAISYRTCSLIYPLLAIVGIIVGYVMIKNMNMVADVRLSLQVGDTMQDPNWIAIFLFAPFCVGLNLIQNKRVILKILGMVLAIYSFYVVFLTGSRGALLGLIAAFLVWIRMTFKKSRGISVALIIAAFILAFYMFIVYMIPAVEVGLIERYTGGEIGDDRTAIWSRLIPEYLNGNIVELMFGRGPGTCVRDVGMSAHNMFLEQLFQTGLFGIILMIVFIFQFFKDTIKCNNVLGLYIISALFTLSLTTPIWGHIYFMTPLAMVAYVNNAQTLKTRQERI